MHILAKIGVNVSSKTDVHLHAGKIFINTFWIVLYRSQFDKYSMFANSVCHLFILWLLKCSCLTFPLVFVFPFGVEGLMSI